MAGTVNAPSALFHFDGSNGSTKIVDTGGNNHVFTLSGTLSIDTSQFKFGGASLHFPAAGNALMGDASPSLMFGTADFTYDFWVYQQSGLTGVISLVSFSNGTSSISIDSANDVIRYTCPAGTIEGTTIFAYNTWHHIAVTRASGGTRLFLDGVLQASKIASDTTNYTLATDEPYIGSGMQGWIDELRIIAGVAAWISAFTSPSAPYADPATAPIFPDFTPIVPPPLFGVGGGPPPTFPPPTPPPIGQIPPGILVGPAIAAAGVPPSLAGVVQPQYKTGSATSPTAASLFPAFTTAPYTGFPNQPPAGVPIVFSNISTNPSFSGGVWTVVHPPSTPTTAVISYQLSLAALENGEAAPHSLSAAATPKRRRRAAHDSQGLAT